MPELPEVESLRRILARAVTGRKIVAATVREPRLRRAVAADFVSRVAGAAIANIGRRAKYLVIELDSDDVLLVHLGMSGSLTCRPESRALDGFDPRHDHVSFELDDGSRLVYNDPRRFGLLKLIARDELEQSLELAGIGPEPFGKEFNPDYLWRISRGRKGAIKNLLMDQAVVAGVGNIYASEILFRAKVRPKRPAGRVTRKELDLNAAITPELLREAIGGGGTTFRSYRDARGQPGRFVDRLRVYDREGQPCLVCSTAIRAVVLGQRSSFYCPACQK
jgi:formamidopyrimidine-DNA glycosylase